MELKEDIREKVQEAKIFGRHEVFLDTNLKTVIAWVAEEIGRQPIEDQDYFVGTDQNPETGEKTRGIFFPDKGPEIMINIPA